jgi:hypothetical protein
MNRRRNDHLHRDDEHADDEHADDEHEGFRMDTARPAS